MEPISTLVLAAAFLVTAPATRLNIWEVPSRGSEKSRVSRTKYILPTAEVVTTDEYAQVLNIDSPVTSPREMLKIEVSAYSSLLDGWNGPHTIAPGHVVTDAALQFIDAIPSRLPLPRPMLSSSGEVGLYWDFVAGYAEASFDSFGTAAFFSRDEDGHERFDEAIEIGQLDEMWFWTAIGPLDSKMPVAA
jgi:hypothetical protein